MRNQTKVTVALAVFLALVLVGLIGAVVRQSGSGPQAVSTQAGEFSAVMREDSRMLGERGTSRVVLVEFLDFECEACGAFYPLVEQLRQDYAGEVTFVARYFPLPGHFNSERAARAVESAARQGEFLRMYDKMFTTQKQWGEQQQPLDDLFRRYAEQIGLDMQTYDADYASQEVADRVQRDVADGRSLGVDGTPTFYLDGQPLQPQGAQDFYTAIDQALGR